MQCFVSRFNIWRNFTYFTWTIRQNYTFRTFFFCSIWKESLMKLIKRVLKLVKSQEWVLPTEKLFYLLIWGRLKQANNRLSITQGQLIKKAGSKGGWNKYGRENAFCSCQICVTAAGDDYHWKMYFLFYHCMKLWERNWGCLHKKEKNSMNVVWWLSNEPEALREMNKLEQNVKAAVVHFYRCMSAAKVIRPEKQLVTDHS